MSTIKMSDVAAHAGVSLSTVGRVIHHNGYVSEENRFRVEKAIQTLGYIPNTIARGLKNSSSRMLGHIVKFTPNLLFEQISRAVDQAAAAQGYSVLGLTKYDFPGEDERIITEFIGRRVDGVIITSVQDFDPALIEKLYRAGIPVVRIERAPIGCDRVLVDDLEGTREAVTSILQAGHRKVAFIGSLCKFEVEQLRLEGYRRALQDGGITPELSLQRHMPEYTPAYGFEAMQSLWEQERPTAVFATADTLAVGILQYLYSVGVRVPKDISVMGYDNTLSTLLSPPISSVGIHADEMGKAAVEMLLLRKSNPLIELQEVVVGTELVDRKTILPLALTK